MLQFVIQIELGNDAMRTGGDIGKAIRHVAREVAIYNEKELRGLEGAPTKIRDENGNTVGEWRVEWVE